MSRCRLYSDSIIRPILRRELSKEDYEKVSEHLKNCPKVDAIPEGYIVNYASKRDPVCSNNLTNMIEHFHLDCGGDYGKSTE